MNGQRVRESDRQTDRKIDGRTNRETDCKTNAPLFFSSGNKASFLDLALPPVVSITSTHSTISNMPGRKESHEQKLLQFRISPMDTAL